MIQTRPLMNDKQIYIQKLAVGEKEAIELSAENPCDIIFNSTTRCIYVEGSRFGESDPARPVTRTGL